jgi:hypothetical protein
VVSKLTHNSETIEPVSTAYAASVLGVSRQALNKLRPQAPDSVVERHRQGYRWHLPELVAWWVDRHSASGTEADQQLARWRAARADAAEMHVQRLRGELVPPQAYAEQLSRLKVILRAAGERLRRQYGDDASAILNEALDEFIAYEQEKTETSAAAG